MLGSEKSRVVSACGVVAPILLAQKGSPISLATRPIQPSACAWAGSAVCQMAMLAKWLRLGLG